MNYYNQSMLNQLMRQKDNIENMITQYSQQPPVQNIINTITGAEFEAKILKEGEEVSNIFVNKKTMILDKYNKKLFIKELNGDISEEYEIVLPLDEKDKKIQELENKIKEMEMKQSNGSINSKPTNEIKQSTTDDNKPGREHQSK